MDGCMYIYICLAMRNITTMPDFGFNEKLPGELLKGSEAKWRSHPFSACRFGVDRKQAQLVSGGAVSTGQPNAIGFYDPSVGILEIVCLPHYTYFEDYYYIILYIYIILYVYVYIYITLIYIYIILYIYI